MNSTGNQPLEDWDSDAQTPPKWQLRVTSTMKCSKKVKDPCPVGPEKAQFCLGPLKGDLRVSQVDLGAVFVKQPFRG